MDNGIALICGVRIPSELIFKPIAHIAGSDSPVYVLDGDNSFRSYLIARYARQMHFDPRRALANVQVSRAFTCYQFAEIVARLCRQADTAGDVGVPCAGIVCLGLLGTFYDEDVALPEARRLLQEVITNLKLLAERWLVIVTVRPPPSKAGNRLMLMQTLMHQADAIRVLQAEPGYGRLVQPPLRLISRK